MRALILLAALAACGAPLEVAPVDIPVGADTVSQVRESAGKG